ncbi:MAG: Ger(x)C family spore germination protein [Oscillospiraceae bacterium]
MKRIIALILILPLVLTGCVRTEELRDRGIIQCFGVDFKNNIYYVTLQVFNNNVADGGSENKESNSKILTGSGETISEAVYNAGNSCGKLIFIGNCKIIIIGKQAAMESIEQIFGYFNGDYQTRVKTKVLVCNTTANEFVCSKSSDGKLISAQEMADIAQAAEEMGVTGDSNIVHSVAALNNNIQSGFLLGYVSSTSKNDSVSCEIIGNVMFINDKYVGIINRSESRGTSWINAKIPWTILTSQKSNSENVSIIAKNSSSNVKCELVDGKLVFDIKVKFSGNLSEIVQKDQTGATLKDLKEIGDICANEAQEEIVSAIQKTVIENGCDVFDFNEYASLKYSRFVQENADNWSDIIKKSKFNVIVSCNLDRMAFEGEHAN